MSTRPSWQARIIKRQQLTTDTWQFSLTLEGEPFQYQAGQFISLLFEWQGEFCRRSYSIANSPEQYQRDGVIELVAHCLPDGKASQFLLAATPDTDLKVLGPFGQLVLPCLVTAKRLLLLATGTGVAPYRAMLPELLQLLDQGLEVVLLMGIRTRADYFYGDDLRQLLGAGGAIWPCYSRESEVAAGELAGYVQAQFERLQPDPENDLVYLCGTPQMIDDSVKELMGLGFGVKQIKREKYVFSGH